jgi:glucose dehydrogenase
MNKPLLALLVLIFLALIANLVIVAVTSQSPVTEDILQIVLFWALAGANLAMSGAGIYFVTRAHSKHEKSALLWARRAFAATLLVNVLLSIAPWVFIEVGKDVDTRLDAMFNTSIMLLLFGVPVALFTMAFYRDFRRIVGNRPTGSGGSRRHGE